MISTVFAPPFGEKRGRKENKMVGFLDPVR
ncbi:MAG: hypothetical protein ACJAU0_001674 [Flavobacteriales bacterium]|jgi:hypothetical protein